MLVVVDHIPAVCGSHYFKPELGLLAIHHQPACRKTKVTMRIHERSSRCEVEKMWRFCRRRWASKIKQWTTGSCRGRWLQFPREWGGGGKRGGGGERIRTAEVHNHSEKATTAEERDGRED
uniref:Uncharacterized protein n=1 Tax=Triticum urartu TaxID=4572 RepID=A0A8R7U3G3_TRIUA